MTSGERFVVVLVGAGYVLTALSYLLERIESQYRRGLYDTDHDRRAELVKELRRYDD